MTKTVEKKKDGIWKIVPYKGLGVRFTRIEDFFIWMADRGHEVRLKDNNQIVGWR